MRCTGDQHHLIHLLSSGNIHGDPKTGTEDDASRLPYHVYSGSSHGHALPPSLREYPIPLARQTKSWTSLRALRVLCSQADANITHKPPPLTTSRSSAPIAAGLVLWRSSSEQPENTPVGSEMRGWYRPFEQCSDNSILDDVLCCIVLACKYLSNTAFPHSPKLSVP